MSKKVHFWLYNGETRVTGLYGMFCQFTDEPKEYTYSEEQVKIVLGNLENKIERLAAEAKEPKHLGDAITMLADSHSKSAIEFDQVRIYTVENELVEAYSIGEKTSIFKRLGEPA